MGNAYYKKKKTSKLRASQIHNDDLHQILPNLKAASRIINKKKKLPTLLFEKILNDSRNTYFESCHMGEW